MMDPDASSPNLFLPGARIHGPVGAFCQGTLGLNNLLPTNLFVFRMKPQKMSDCNFLPTNFFVFRMKPQKFESLSAVRRFSQPSCGICLAPPCSIDPRRRRLGDFSPPQLAVLCWSLARLKAETAALEAVAEAGFPEWG